jgi:hypothetical protein
MAQLTPRGFPAQTTSVLICDCWRSRSSSRWLPASCSGWSLPCKARASLRDAIQQGGRASVGGRARLTRDALVVLQVAAALVLLAGAGLMLRTMANLRALELGFRPDHVLTLRTTLPQSKYQQPAQRLSFYDRVIADVRTLPGVEGAGYTSLLPFLSPGNTTWFAIDGVTHDPDDPQDTLFRAGTSDYLKTLGVARGRTASRRRDGVDAPRVVVVNSTLARNAGRAARAWRQDAAGQPDGPFYTIVGVVKDVRERGHTLAKSRSSACHRPAPRGDSGIPGRADCRRACRSGGTDSPCHRARRPGSANIGGANDGRDCRPRRRRSAPADAPARRIRGAGAAPRLDRAVRRVVVCGCAAQS